jgi:uncharacterized protein (DUF849 family)
MLLKAEINGRRGLSEHPAIPISPEQQAKQAAMAVAAGAGAIHVHPRNSAGQESLAPQDIANALNAIRLMDVDGERFLTILYVSNFAELPRSVFIRTQIQTAALSGKP